MTRIYALAAIVTVISGLLIALALIWLNREDAQFASCGVGQVAGNDQIGGPFTLIDENGNTVSEQDVITDLTLLYFGYIYCPNICPLDNARNGDAVRLLEDRGVSINPVFVTVDPERDTPEALRDFTDLFHERLLGLTGSDAQIDQAKQAYKVYGAKAPGEEDEEFYLVDHTTLSYLMHPEHGLLAFFRRDVTSEQMADQIACVADAL